MERARAGRAVPRTGEGRDAPEYSYSDRHCSIERNGRDLSSQSNSVWLKLCEWVQACCGIGTALIVLVGELSKDDRNDPG